MIQDVLTAALEPFSNTDTWYGVLFALAFKKQVRTFIDLIFGGLTKSIPERYKDGK